VRIRRFSYISNPQLLVIPPEELPAFEYKPYFEGSWRRPYLARFAALFFLTAVIFSGGIVADSTATVIGAILIAPLMTPAIAAAIVMGYTYARYLLKANCTCQIVKWIQMAKGFLWRRSNCLPSLVSLTSQNGCLTDDREI